MKSVTKIESWDILKKYFPNIYIYSKEIVYNKTQNIEKYFGKKVLMVKNGHDGYGFDIRLLKGYYEKDEKLLEIKREDGSSICEVRNWVSDIFLKHRWKHIFDLASQLLLIGENNRNSSLWTIKKEMSWKVANENKE